MVDASSPAPDSRRCPPADRNPWFSWTYVSSTWRSLATALSDHVLLTLVPVVLALVIAFPLALVARRWRMLQAPILVSAGAIYTIPSLALFGFLWPVFGLSRKTVVIALTVYALLDPHAQPDRRSGWCRPRRSETRLAAWGSEALGCSGASSCR